MPEKLDRCVRQVKRKLKQKGLSDKNAESRAWAICRSRLKLSLQEETEDETDGEGERSSNPTEDEDR